MVLCFSSTWFSKLTSKKIWWIAKASFHQTWFFGCQYHRMQCYLFFGVHNSMVEFFTSTGEGFTFDSMIARFSFASTAKCNSMIELFTSTGEGFDSTIARFSFASTGKCNSMGELFTSTGKGFDSTIKFKSNYLPQRAKVLTQRLHAFLSPRRANVTQCNGRIIYLNGKGFGSTIKFNASTGEEYCESTGKYITIIP